MRRKMMFTGTVGLATAGVLGVCAVAVAGHGARWMTESNGVATQAAAWVARDDGQARTDGTRRGVSVEVRDVHGKPVALVTVTTLPGGGNLVRVRASNLTPGFHAIHIHAVGTCDPAGAKPFASAGGHFNPTGKPEGMQAGAFPVLLAGADGTAATEFVDGNFKLTDLFGTSGSAIVIHSGPDNYANIPTRYAANGVSGPDAETQMTGDAGSRVACGVIAKPQPAPSGSSQPAHHS